MEYRHKTRENLINALQELQLENENLKLSLEKNFGWNPSSVGNGESYQIDFRETKEYFDLIFNANPDSALITRLNDGRMVEVNDGFTKHFGFTREESLGVSGLELNLWKNPEDRQAVVLELLKNGYCENFECLFRRKDGRTLIGLISAKTFMLKGIPHIFSITRDVTEYKKAEANLIESEEKFRSLYANMMNGSALHTLVYNDQGVPEDYRIIEVNPAFESQLGISRETVINKTGRVAYGVDNPPYFDIYSKVALTGKPEVFETYFAPLDKHFSISVYGLRKGSFATIFENITERKRVEMENERTQKLLEDSQRIGKIGGWEYHLDTQELKWTREMYNIHEVDLSFNPMVDLRVNFFTQESLSVIDKAVQDAIEQGKSYDVDLEIVTAKGNHRSIKSLGEADPEHRRIFGFFQDISERKSAEAELRIKNEQLKELNATKDKFFSIIAHDLKSPFNGILGFSGMLKNEARDLDIESIVNYADIINSSAQNALELLETLLEWARMQQGAVPFEPGIILLNTLVNSEIEELKYNANQKNITLVNGINENIILSVDENMVRTILRNLISNALKFTPKNGKVKIEVQKKVGQVEISVSDTGLGLTKETIKKLFKIETSFTTRGTENEKGTGLGLLLCKEFVEKHGGSIWVESEFGMGSRFIFSLPFRD